MFELGFIFGLVVFATYTIFRNAFRIEEGNVGLVTSFGRVLRVGGSRSPVRKGGEEVTAPPRVFRPGLHLKWPWQEVHQVPLMEQMIDLSGTHGAQTAMAEDGTVLRFESILRYIPLEKTLYDFVFDLRSPRDHITSLFTCMLRNEIANFRDPQRTALESLPPGGSYALIRRERRKLNAEIMTFCQQEIGGKYGVEFSAVDLVDILPPDELDEALNAAIHAQSEAEAAYAVAEAEAQRRIIAAKRGVEIAETKASAVEQEVKTIASRLQELDKTGTLDLYVERRNAEVLAQSRTHFVRRDR